MEFNIYNSLILAGVIQGLIFAGIFFQSQKLKSKSTFFLAAVILIYSLSNLQFLLCDVGLISYDELFKKYYVPWGNLVPPLLYYYTVTYLNDKKSISRSEKLLLLPFIVSLLLSFVYKAGFWFKDQFLQYKTIRYYLESYDEIIAAVFHIIIIVVVLRKIMVYKIEHKQFQFKHIIRQVNWLVFTYILLFFGIVLWIVLTIKTINNTTVVSFYPLWLTMAFLIYWFGYVGVYKNGILKEREQIRYKSSPISNKKQVRRNTIVERLEDYLVNQRQFLNANLTLENTAAALKVSQGHLSKLINQELQMSFKDYVNRLRVEEAKRYLKDDAFSNYTILAIGLEAGFNSKSAFNTSFKKIAGSTPSQFKKVQTK